MPVPEARARMTPQPAAGGGMFLPVAAAALLWLMLPSCAASRADLGADGLVPGGLRSGSVRTIVAFGDSVVQGWHASEGWPSILGRRLVAGGQAVEVFNTGRTGDTALDGLSRLDGDVLSKDPDLVLLAFGLNDMRKRIPPHRFKETLKLKTGWRFRKQGRCWEIFPPTSFPLRPEQF